MIRLFLFLLSLMYSDIQAMNVIVDHLKLSKAFSPVVSQTSVLKCGGMVNNHVLAVTMKIDIDSIIQTITDELSDYDTLVPNVNGLLSSGDYADSFLQKDFGILSSIGWKDLCQKEKIDLVTRTAFNAEETLRRVYYGLIPEYSGHISDENLKQLEHFFLRRLEIVEMFNEGLRECK